MLASTARCPTCRRPRPRPWRAGPTIGQDTEYVLRDLLGFTDDEITRSGRSPQALT